MHYEYKVVPAPQKAAKKGGKTPEDRFAAALSETMNTLAAEGWEYQRADTLPCQERAGLTQTQTVWRHMLVFRRPVAAATEPATPQAQTGPDASFATRQIPAEPSLSLSAPAEARPAESPAEDREIVEPVRKLFATKDIARPGAVLRAERQTPERGDRAADGTDRD